jgi:hypothetical protein
MSVIDMPDLPDFLDRTSPVFKNLPPRTVNWTAPARRERKPRHDLPRTMTPTAWALLKEREAKKEYEKRERLRALRERRGA